MDRSSIPRESIPKTKHMTYLVRHVGTHPPSEDYTCDVTTEEWQPNMWVAPMTRVRIVESEKARLTISITMRESKIVSWWAGFNF